MHRMVFVTCTALLWAWLSSSAASAQEVLALEWDDLLPEKDLQAYLNAPEIDHEAATADDVLMQMPEEFRNALQSVDVNPEYLNRKVMLPGFIVPLEFDDRRRVTEFFLVPYFGACIHYPPPPPNQLVHVLYPKGAPLRELYEPFVVHGTLQSEVMESALGRSAYRMEADSVSVMDY